MPFLLIAPTRLRCCPPITPVNNVGVDPKSLSPPCWFGGTAQEPTRVRSEACTSTIAGASGSLLPQAPPLPVVKYSVPAEVSSVGDPHTPPPVQPLGTTLNVCLIAPVDLSSSRSWPWTSGQSPKDETPMYTLLPFTSGDDHTK